MFVKAPTFLQFSFFSIVILLWQLKRDILPVSVPVLGCALVTIYAGIILSFLSIKTLYKRRTTPLKDLPGPKSANWLYGHASDLFDEPLAARVSDWINEMEYPDGLMHLFGLFGSSYLVPTGPESLTEVLSTRAYDYVKPSGFKRYTLRFWGHGIVSQEQDEHKQHRKAYLPVFNQQNVQRLQPTLAKKSQQFIDYVSSRCTFEGDVEKNISSAVVPIAEAVALVSLDVTGIFSLGIDFETILGKHTGVFEAHETLFTNLVPSKVGKRLDGAHELLVDVCRRVVRERVEQLKKGEADEMDFVTAMVKKNMFDEDAAIAHIVVILGAGYESTGGTLAWAFYLLAKHQDAQTALRKELMAAKNERGSLTENEYNNLPFLNAVVMETTRIYPAFSFLLRKAMRNTTISGRHVPKGTYVALCPHAINHAQHLWGPDADEFRPDRWIDDSNPNNVDANGGAPSNVCMFSFFYGARSCVGRPLALAQMKRQIGLVLENFSLERVDGYEPKQSGLFATSPPHELKVRFTKLPSSGSNSQRL